MLHADNKNIDYRYFYLYVNINEVDNMKINDIHRTGAVNPYRKTADSQLSQTESKKKKIDEVNISSEAKELQSSTETRRVESLKQSYISGTYHVEAHKIADKLLPYL
jgi:negative regulator of flagellin synthesis FlgM